MSIEEAIKDDPLLKLVKPSLKDHPTIALFGLAFGGCPYTNKNECPYSESLNSLMNPNLPLGTKQNVIDSLTSNRAQELYLKHLTCPYAKD